MKKTTFNAEILQHGIDNLQACIDSDRDNIYGADLHHELYNLDYFVIGTYNAKVFLDTIPGGPWKAIETVEAYEKDRFGEKYTDCSNPEKVANMYAYIIGEEILNESKVLQSCWNDRLTVDDLRSILDELNNL